MQSHTLIEAIEQEPKPAKDKFNRRAWNDDVHADKDASPNVKLLAFGISKFVNNETGEAYPSTRTLAEKCGMSDAWVRNNIPALQASGWSDVEYGSRGRGAGHCNRFRINPEKRTLCTLLAAPEKRTDEIIKPHTVYAEPREGKKEEETKTVEASSLLTTSERADRPALTDRVLELPRDPKRDSAYAGRLDRSEDHQSEIETPDPLIGRFACVASAGDGAVSQHHQPEETIMDEAARKARADRIEARRHSIRMFEVIRQQYPRLDDGKAARAAYDAMLAGAEDPGQLRCMLLDAVTTIARRKIAADRLRPLAVFIAKGNWRTDLWAVTA